MEPTIATPKPVSKFKRGWELTKSAWQVLKLDKELAGIPILGMLLSILIIIPLGFIWFSMGTFTETADGMTFTSDLGSWSYVVYLLFYVLMATVSNFFAAAVTHGALQRFNGGDPTVKGSLRAAWRRIDSIAAFSVLSATVGIILSVIEERVPLAGKIAVWIANAAWSVATFFALPILVTSETHINPLEAVRTSANLIKKVWGESVIAQLGVTIIAILFVTSYSFIAISLLAALVNASQSDILIGTAIGLTVLGLFALILVFTILSSIARAAAYYYATTGKSPLTFNQNLLQTAMAQKRHHKAI